MKPHRSNRARLLHARDAILQIFVYLGEDPERGNRTRDAVIRQLEIIGEACNHVSPDIKASYDEIPWRDIINMRHHLTHGYFQVAVKNVWDTADNDLKPLLESILAILDNPDVT